MQKYTRTTKRNVIFILSIIWLNCILFALPTIAQQDTIIRKTETIEITSDGILQNPAFIYSPSNIISLNEIRTINLWQISDGLKLSPGIFIKDYGGLGGMKTVSIRGSSASHTAILIDGNKLNSTQSGMLDLSIIPISLMREVEIIRGGSSAAVGGNAISGAINFKTPIDTNKFEIGLNAGSYNEYMASMILVNKLLNIPIGLAFDYTYGKGNYLFEFNQFGETKTERRTNAGYDNYSLSIFSQFNPTKSIIVKPLIIINFSDKGVPGSVVQGVIENVNTSYAERNILFMLNGAHYPSNIYFSIVAKNTQSIYKDLRNISFNQTSSKFDAGEYMLTAKHIFNYRYFSGDVSFEVAASSLKGDMLDPSAGNEVSRNAIAGGMRLKREEAVANGLLTYQLVGRYDAVSSTENNFSGMLGANYFFDNYPLELRTSISRDFRTPSFNEMYYLNFGTADLRSETSYSANLGFVNKLFNQRLSLSVDVFYMLIDNMITAIPKNPVSWSATNIGKVENRGIEISLHSSLFKELLNISVSLTLQNTEELTPNSLTKGNIPVYTPQEIVFTSLLWDVKYFNFGTTLEYVGSRWSLANNSYDSYLEDYAIFSIFVLKEFNISDYNLEFRIDGINLSNEQYQIIKNYPMPGRVFRAGLKIKI